jgi:hypothetical protein
MKIKEVFFEQDLPEIEGEEEFAVKRSELKHRISLHEIEDSEIVGDPLDAVPNLPFGHLNMAWRTFLQDRLEGDELWSFKSQWQSSWGQKEIRSGYVIVQQGKPGAYFLTDTRFAAVKR